MTQFETPNSVFILVGDARRSAIETIKQHHYTHSVPSGKSHYMQFREAIIVWSLPANNNIAKFILGWKGIVWELSRLWAPDDHERNLLTQAISRSLKRLVKIENPDAVISYADPSVGHSGGVYRAASWIAYGQSEENRTYRSADGKIIARRAFHSGRKFLLKHEIEQMGYVQLNLPGKYRFVRLLSKRARQVK